VKDIVILTDDRLAEARQVRDALIEQGWRVETVPRAICLWDEAALSAWAAPFSGEIAGVIHPAPTPILGAVEAVSEAQWRRATDEGPMAAWCVTKVFCDRMKASGGGSMIYLNSIHAEKPVGHGALFSMGCAAAQMLCKEVNQDYGEFGVRAFFIQKGITESDPDAKSPVSNLYYGVDLRYPARRLPEAGYLNSLVAFLLTPGAAALSGSDLMADGGMVQYYTHRRQVEGRPYYGWPK